MPVGSKLGIPRLQVRSQQFFSIIMQRLADTRRRTRATHNGANHFRNEGYWGIATTQELRPSRVSEDLIPVCEFVYNLVVAARSHLRTAVRAGASRLIHTSCATPVAVHHSRPSRHFRSNVEQLSARAQALAILVRFQMALMNRHLSPVSNSVLIPSLDTTYIISASYSSWLCMLRLARSTSASAVAEALVRRYPLRAIVLMYH